MNLALGRGRFELPILALALAAAGAAVASEPLITLTLVIGALGLTLLFAQGLRTLVVGALFVFPLVPSGLRVASVGEIYPQRVLLIVLGFALLLDSELWTRHSWRLAKLGAARVLFIAFLVVGCLAAVVSPLPATALSGVAFYALHVGLPFLIGLLAAEKPLLEKYGAAVAVAALAVAMIAVLQYVAPGGPWTTLLPEPTMALQNTADTGIRALNSRASSTLGHPVALGTYAVMTIPFLIRLMFGTSRRTAYLAQAALVALVLAVMLSQTRMAMLALPAALLPWILFGTRRRALARLAIIAAVGLLAVVGTGGVLQQRDILAETLSYRGERSSRDASENSIAARSNIYVTGLAVLKAHPLVGVGYRLPTQHFDAPIFQRAGQVYAFESYLMVLLVEGGLIGSGLFAAFVVALALAAKRRVSSPDDRLALYAALLVGLALSVGSNGFDIVASYYWLLNGLLFGWGLAAPESAPSSESVPAS